MNKPQEALRHLVVDSDIAQFNESLAVCKDVFCQKVKDYGAAFRILRPASITDILYIKLCRIRSIESKGVQRVSDPIRLDYISLVNYSIMALIQLRQGLPVAPMEAAATPWKELAPLYDAEVAQVAKLLADKNHDYDAAWKQMNLHSIHDILLMRMLRLKQMEQASEKPLNTADYAENYQDIINYAVFCMAKIAQPAPSTQDRSDS